MVTEYPICLSEVLGGVHLFDRGDMLMRISYDYDNRLPC